MKVCLIGGWPIIWPTLILRHIIGSMSCVTVSVWAHGTNSSQKGSVKLSSFEQMTDLELWQRSLTVRGRVLHLVNRIWTNTLDKGNLAEKLANLVWRSFVSRICLSEWTPSVVLENLPLSDTSLVVHSCLYLVYLDGWMQLGVDRK